MVILKKIVNLRYQKGCRSSTLTKENFCPINGEYLTIKT